MDNLFIQQIFTNPLLCAVDGKVRFPMSGSRGNAQENFLSLLSFKAWAWAQALKDKSVPFPRKASPVPPQTTLLLSLLSCGDPSACVGPGQHREKARTAWGTRPGPNNRWGEGRWQGRRVKTPQISNVSHSMVMLFLSMGHLLMIFPSAPNIFPLICPLSQIGCFPLQEACFAQPPLICVHLACSAHHNLYFSL